MNGEGQTFWEHLDVLRSMLIRIAVVTVLFAVAAFSFKEEMFSIILAPKESEFVTYRLLAKIGIFSSPDNMPADFSVSLINTGLAQQFIIHMQAAVSFGFLCASPYILYQLFRFVSPALYAEERRYAFLLVGSSYIMFILGVMISYFLIFPFTFRFLGTYQVSSDIENMISITSYMNTFLFMCLAMGVIFEMPVLTWLFAKFGFITADFMKNYRKHAYVVILILAAVITPTSDVVTLMLVSLPMILLYELSIVIAGAVQNNSLTPP